MRGIAQAIAWLFGWVDRKMSIPYARVNKLQRTPQQDGRTVEGASRILHNRALRA